MAAYRPKFVHQYDDPTTSLDWFNCTMASGAMALDFDTLGHVQVLGGQLRNVSGDKIGGTGLGNPGLTRSWAHYGQVLDVGTGGHFDDVITALKRHRGVILQGLYSALPKAYHSKVNSLGFGGAHAVYLNPEFNTDGYVLMGDPLNDKWIWVPQAALRSFANALGAHEKGAHNPQPIFFATSDAHVPVTVVDPQKYVHKVKATAKPTLNVRTSPTTTAKTIAPDLKFGEVITTTWLRKRGGAYTVNGTIRSDWLGFTRSGKTVWIARGYTTIVS
jgi:hypothetical protein